MFYLASHFMLVGKWNIGEHITSLQRDRRRQWLTYVSSMEKWASIRSHQKCERQEDVEIRDRQRLQKTRHQGRERTSCSISTHKNNTKSTKSTRYMSQLDICRDGRVLSWLSTVSGTRHVIIMITTDDKGWWSKCRQEDCSMLVELIH